MSGAIEDRENEAPRKPAGPYLDGLREYLSGGGEVALKQAYELGRSALAESKSILEILHLHHAALQTLLQNLRDPEETVRILRGAEEFLIEVLSPYEMIHRGFREAIVALRHLNETLEQEIKRIAHAVHDEAGQLLVAVRLELADLVRDLPAPLHHRIGGVNELLDQIEEQLRRISHELRPTILDDLGLVPAIHFLAGGVSKRTDQAIFIHASFKDRLPAAVETALYRIVQEALTNAAKHSHARNVHIQLDRSGGLLRCVIHDDGKGFDVQAALDGKGNVGLGLLGMQERLSAVGGTLHIESAPGQGTSLLIKISLEGRT